MIQKYKKVLLAGLAMSLYAQGLHASPFCAGGQGLPQECIYNDAAECRKNAMRISGLCTVNTAEVHIQPGVGKYCLVYSTLVTMCTYIDRTSCDRDAMRNGAVCIESPSSNVQKDPYLSDPNSKY